MDLSILNLENYYGLKVKELRIKRNLSQLKLEILLDMSIGAISKIESGRTNPTKETLYKIAIGLNLTYEEIIELFNINKVYISG